MTGCAAWTQFSLPISQSGHAGGSPTPVGNLSLVAACAPAFLSSVVFVSSVGSVPASDSATLMSVGRRLCVSSLGEVTGRGLNAGPPRRLGVRRRHQGDVRGDAVLEARAAGDAVGGQRGVRQDDT